VTDRFSKVRNAIALALTGAYVLVAAVGCLRPKAANRHDLRPPVHRDTVSISSPAQAIYSSDPNDPWNRIFNLLFTRAVKTNMSSDFPEAGPFVSAEAMLVPGLRISRRRFDRLEIGDRAIEPLYPSFFSAVGSQQVLTEPHFSELKQALSEAIIEQTVRPAVARALMQSDAWAAYDVLFAHVNAGDDDTRQQLLSLLARFVRKLALSGQEIRSLGNNYSSAVRTKHLPNLFSPADGWIEIQLLPNRAHDHAANYRRAARVFVKPRQIPQDKSSFVESLKHNQHLDQVEATALIIQNLLIDSDGKPTPSPIFCDLQIRLFSNEESGVTEVREYELSRRLLLSEPETGGFAEFDEKAPTYLTASGNDFGFATPLLTTQAPVLDRLRTRCIQCHSQSLKVLMTFALQDFFPLPSVSVLDSTKNEHALYVAGKKADRDDYKTLLLRK